MIFPPAFSTFLAALLEIGNSTSKTFLISPSPKILTPFASACLRSTIPALAKLLILTRFVLRKASKYCRLTTTGFDFLDFNFPLPLKSGNLLMKDFFDFVPVKRGFTFPLALVPLLPRPTVWPPLPEPIPRPTLFPLLVVVLVNLLKAVIFLF